MPRLTIAFLVGALSSAFAATPSLDGIYPIAWQTGSTGSIQLVGKFDPWPPKIWLNTAGITVSPSTNSGKCNVTIASNAPAGAHLVRVYNEDGASMPRIIVLTDTTLLLEQEPNDDPDKPQVTPLPCSVNGRLEKNDDVDFYGIDLSVGQSITATLQGYVLWSPMDAVLRLVDDRGVEVAFNHDDGQTLDPQLTFTAKKSGKYILQVFGFAYPADSNVRFVGNNKCNYLLQLTNGIERADFGSTTGSETETNASIPVSVPCALKGSISSPSDVDAFSFQAKKGEKLSISVESAPGGLPLDLWLKLTDKSGKELAKNDDARNADPLLDWTAPEEGQYVASVANRLRRGGPDHLYRFVVTHPVPDLQSTVADHSFTLEAGKTNSIKVTFKRLHGFNSKLRLTAQGLPATIAAPPLELSDSATEGQFQISASTNAEAWSGPFQLIAQAGTNNATTNYPIAWPLVSSGVDNGVPNGHSKLVVEKASDLWLTVRAAKKQ